MTDGRYRDDTYTPAQAAHILRLTPPRVRQLLQSGDLEGERDGAGHRSFLARAVHVRLERLRRESLLGVAGYDPSSIHESREPIEALRAQVETLYAQLEEAGGHAPCLKVEKGSRDLADSLDEKSAI